MTSGSKTLVTVSFTRKNWSTRPADRPDKMNMRTSLPSGNLSFLTSMTAVPAVTTSDQLTSYVSVSPGWNARMRGGRGAVACSSTLNAPGTKAGTNAKKHRAIDVHKALRDAVRKGYAIR